MGVSENKPLVISNREWRDLCIELQAMVLALAADFEAEIDDRYGPPSVWPSPNFRRGRELERVFQARALVARAKGMTP
jgi:predicted pyridoxine 5'-phosphate oxidase superfamily flavin-nucleotide-binding protein